MFVTRKSSDVELRFGSVIGVEIGPACRPGDAFGQKHPSGPRPTDTSNIYNFPARNSFRVSSDHHNLLTITPAKETRDAVSPPISPSLLQYYRDAGKEPLGLSSSIVISLSCAVGQQGSCPARKVCFHSDPPLIRVITFTTHQRKESSDIAVIGLRVKDVATNPPALGHSIEAWKYTKHDWNASFSPIQGVRHTTSSVLSSFSVFHCNLQPVPPIYGPSYTLRIVFRTIKSILIYPSLLTLPATQVSALYQSIYSFRAPAPLHPIYSCYHASSTTAYSPS